MSTPSDDANADAWAAGRSADWRFVVPPGEGNGLGRILLIGATDAVAAALRDTGAVVHRDHCPPGSADVAAVFRDSDVPIAAVVAMLAPTGTLYWEIGRTRWSRLRTSPAVARSRLREAKLAPVETYWITSGPAGPSMHLPLGHDGAVRWYFVEHHGPSSRLRRVAGRMLRLLVRGRGRRLERLVPLFAVTARRLASAVEAGDAGPRGASAVAHARVLAQAMDRDARPIVLAGGEGPWSRTVLLPFERGAEQPAGVIKVARASAYAAGLIAEQEVLARLRATTPTIAASVPEPLGPVRLLGQPGAAERYRPGASIAVRATRWNVSEAARRLDLERAAEWLRDLHEATATGVSDLGVSGFDIGGLIVRYVEVFGHDATEKRWFEYLHGFVDRDVEPLPSALRHRDFGPWNVLVDSGGVVSVIDWEVAGDGPPLVDLVYFVAHWCWMVAGASCHGRDADVLRRLVLGEGSNWYLEAGRAAIAAHARRLGLTADAVTALVAWTFVEQALDRYDRFAAIGDPAAADRASNRYVGYVSTLAGLADLTTAITGWLLPARDHGA